MPRCRNLGTFFHYITIETTFNKIFYQIFSKPNIADVQKLLFCPKISKSTPSNCKKTLFIFYFFIYIFSNLFFKSIKHFTHPLSLNKYNNFTLFERIPLLFSLRIIIKRHLKQKSPHRDLTLILVKMYL